MGFWTDWPHGLRISSATQIARDIKGRTVRKIYRLGKAILIELSRLPRDSSGQAGGRTLSFHQRMSGKILLVPRGIKDKHIHFRFSLSDGKDLILHDIRKFGVVWYGKTPEVLGDEYFLKLGHDPLRISFEDLKNSLKMHSGMIKPLLLRQDILSGVGNIVADESLWKAKIHPRRKVETLAGSELENLYLAIHFVLKKSIRLGGTTMRDWLHPDKTEGRYFAKRLVYERKNEKCRRCKTIIKRTVVGSRGTFICESCQRLK